VLGAGLPTAQENRYRRILGHKYESQYGARSAIVALYAQRLLDELQKFAFSVETQF